MILRLQSYRKVDQFSQALKPTQSDSMMIRISTPVFMHMEDQALSEALVE